MANSNKLNPAAAAGLIVVVLIVIAVVAMKMFAPAPVTAISAEDHQRYEQVMKQNQMNGQKMQSGAASGMPGAPGGMPGAPGAPAGAPPGGAPPSP